MILSALWHYLIFIFISNSFLHCLALHFTKIPLHFAFLLYSIGILYPQYGQIIFLNIVITLKSTRHYIIYVVLLCRIRYNPDCTLFLPVFFLLFAHFGKIPGSCKSSMPKHSVFIMHQYFN